MASRVFWPMKASSRATRVKATVIVLSSRSARIAANRVAPRWLRSGLPSGMTSGCMTGLLSGHVPRPGLGDEGSLDRLVPDRCLRGDRDQDPADARPVGG